MLVLTVQKKLANFDEGCAILPWSDWGGLHWIKEVAPSATLRRWFGHEPARWDEFRRRYGRELKEHQKELNELRGLARHGAITLVYAARDQAHNEAVVLRDLLLRQ